MNFKDYSTVDYLDAETGDDLEYDDDMTDLSTLGGNYTDDSVKVYMREMGKFQLLDRDPGD